MLPVLEAPPPAGAAAGAVAPPPAGAPDLAEPPPAAGAVAPDLAAPPPAGAVAPDLAAPPPAGAPVVPPAGAWLIAAKLVVKNAAANKA